MNSIKTITFFLMASFLISASADQKTIELPDSVSSKTKCLNKKVLVYTPKNYKSKDKHPLIIFLHGMGERGTNIDNIKKHGPPKICESMRGFEFIAVSPQCLKDDKGKGWWNTADLNLLYDYILENYKVDKDRIYLTGLSMGGFGSWAWAASNPDKFAAVAPVCGGGNPKQAKKYGKLPIWAFHGDKDTVVAYNKSVEMVEAIKKEGGNAKLTTYKGVGHNSWTQAYNEKELYKWFLSQSK